MEPSAPRLARAADCPALSRLCLRAKASNGYDAAFMAACREELSIRPVRLEHSEIWVIEAAEGGLLACAALEPTAEPDLGEVALFFTQPEAQGQGLGRKLWAQLLERAQARGFARLTLDADPAAVGFYESLGFAVTGQSPSGSVPGRFLPVMTRSI